MPKQTLAEVLAAQAPRNGGAVCVVCETLPILTDQDRAALTEALGNNRMSATMIARALEQYGVNVPVGTLRRHRRRECAALRSVG